jgi:hypothetical protein
VEPKPLSSPPARRIRAQHQRFAEERRKYR